MGRFDERASQPLRGPADMLKWKLLRRSDPRRADFATVDAIRPGVRDGGAAALASGDPVAVWIGHATWALRLGGKLIVTDPIWSKSISGVVPRLVPPGVPLDAMPPIDIVLVTHDHRDHMDLPTLTKLGAAPLYIVPLGNARRIKQPNVVELDWWQTHEVGDVAITLVPARHWSMREPWSKNATLWGGYVIRAREGIAYHAGDTAYGDHFADIAQRVRGQGGIDWAMLPIGGYNPRWFMQSQHVDPDEAARGCVALGAKNLLAMHWGTFRLTARRCARSASRPNGCARTGATMLCPKSACGSSTSARRARCADATSGRAPRALRLCRAFVCDDAARALQIVVEVRARVQVYTPAWFAAARW